MLVCSNVATATVDDDAVSADQLRRLGDEAQAHGVRIAYEALAWGRYVDDYRRAWRIVERADHPAVGVCLDSFHILSRGHDPAAIEQIPGGEDLLPAARGRSRADHGRAVLEPPPPAVPGRGLVRPGGVPRARARRRVHRAGLVGGLQRHLPADRRGAHRPAGQAVADLAGGPGRPATAAVPAGGRPEPAAATSGSPSRSTSSRSRRRTPARSTSCCGCSASRSAATTGASRCGSGPRARPGWSATSTSPATGRRTLAAIGMEVPTRRPRCAAPACSEHRSVFRRTRAGEQDLAAFRAPDGTEIFFADPSAAEPAWVPEFDGGEQPGGAPALAIDHVNLAHPWQTFEESVLFYTSVLALRSQGTQEVAAPTGLVRSQRDALGRRCRPARAQRRARAGPRAAPARRVPQPRRDRSRPRSPARAGCIRCRSRRTTTTTSPPGSTCPRRCSTRCASSACSTTATSRRRVPALLHPHGRRGVLRARPARRRVRRVRRGRRPGPPRRPAPRATVSGGERHDRADPGRHLRRDRRPAPA